MTLKHHDRNRCVFPIAICMALLMSGACSTETDPSGQPLEDGPELKVSAGIASELYSRAFPKDGSVTSGQYYMSYIPASSDDFRVTTVDFGKDATNPQIGVVATIGGAPFKWIEIGGGANPSFYMDNVVPTPGVTPADEMTVEFNDNYKPYIAAIYDSITGKNDLLWSSLQVGRNTTGTLNFNLHHNMARIMVLVNVDKTYEGIEGTLDLRGATVEISNINQTPLSYNRLDGTLALNTTDLDALSSLTLVGDGIDWNVIEMPVNHDTNPYLYQYQTHSFIVPPQTLNGDDYRPRLTIRLTNGRVYSGILPYAMEITDDSATGNPYPVTLYFMKEHLLTIRTLITEDPPQLSFMPVQVVEWVDKGNFTLEGRQSGIYSEEDFLKLIQYYAQNNDYQLQRFGNFTVNVEEDNLIWDFLFWSYVTLDYYDIFGTMKPAQGQSTYGFSFNNFTIVVVKDNVEYKVTPEQLVGILKGVMTPPFR